jgi:hypothetical protein
MDQEELAAAILKHADAYAADRGRRFGDDAYHDIQRFARRAATDIAQLPVAVQPGQLKLVNLSFERLIDEMIGAAQDIKGYDSTRIGEQTLGRALAKLCPLYPFC